MRPVVVLLACLTAGCEIQIPQEKTKQETTVDLGASLWASAQQSCVSCHQSLMTDGNYVAGLDLTDQYVELQDVQPIILGVASEMAPLVDELTQDYKDEWVAWAISNGATLPDSSPPGEFQWRQAQEMQGMSIGQNAATPYGPFFTFDLEDENIYNSAGAEPGSLYVTDYTDGRGFNPPGLDISLHRSRSISGFPSTHPVTYIVPRGQAHHGRYRVVNFRGYVVTSRWAFVGFQARALWGPWRDERQYVRLQFDRDALSWHSKNLTSPSSIETWPWYSDPEQRLVGNVDDSGFYANTSWWWYVSGAISMQPGGEELLYEAQVQNPVTGEILATVSATSPADELTAGAFFFGKYAEHSAGKATRFADWEIDVWEIDGGTTVDVPPWVTVDASGKR